jgi:hypothetical protein
MGNRAGIHLFGLLIGAVSSLAWGQDASTGNLLFPNSDFEQGDLTNWRAEGSAFEHQPTLGDNVEVREQPNRAMPRGNWWVGTYEKYQGLTNEKPGDSQTNAPMGELISTSFVITQPWIGFLVGGGASSKTAVQLVVGGEVAYTASGADSALMRQVFWDVSKYLNRKAMLYIFDRSKEAWGCINADDFRYYSEVPDLLLFPNSDFEKGDLTNWSPSGNAFSYQPTKGDNPAAREAGKSSRHAGEFWIGTYEQYQGQPGQSPGSVQKDAPQGTLTSVPFEIKGPAICFLLGGGDPSGLEVRLLVEGKPVRTAHPGERREDLQPVVWLVDEFKGKKAEIEIMDESDAAWGHINVDDFRYTRTD